MATSDDAWCSKNGWVSETLEGTAFVDDQDAPEARRALAARYQGWREGQALSGWATGAMVVGVRISSRS